MNQVYGHAYCTIAASAAVDSSQGLFRYRHPNMSRRWTREFHISSEPTTYRFRFSVLSKEIDEAPFEFKSLGISRTYPLTTYHILWPDPGVLGMQQGLGMRD